MRVCHLCVCTLLGVWLRLCASASVCVCVCCIYVCVYLCVSVCVDGLVGLGEVRTHVRVGGWVIGWLMRDAGAESGDSVCDAFQFYPDTEQLLHYVEDKVIFRSLTFVASPAERP